MKTTLPPFALGAILLAEGWASLGTEILALRRMAPWAGSSVDVTSVLIAVYLAALRGRIPARREAGGKRRPPPAAGPAAGCRFRLGRLLAGGPRHRIDFLAAPAVAATGGGLLDSRHRAGRLAAGRVRPAGPCLRSPPRSFRDGRRSFRSLHHRQRGRGAGCGLPAAATFGVAAAVLAVVAAPAAAALLASRRDVPVVALLVACCWPAADLWVEATEYVARNAYADYRFVEFDGGRVLIDQQSACFAA